MTARRKAVAPPPKAMPKAAPKPKIVEPALPEPALDLENAPIETAQAITDLIKEPAVVNTPNGQATVKPSRKGKKGAVEIRNVAGMPTVIREGDVAAPRKEYAGPRTCGICMGVYGDHMHPEFGIVDVPNSAYASFDAQQGTVTCLVGDTTTFEIESKLEDFKAHMRSHYHIVREDPSVPESARHHSPPAGQSNMPESTKPAAPAKTPKPKRAPATPAEKAAGSTVRPHTDRATKKGQVPVDIPVDEPTLKAFRQKMAADQLAPSFGQYVRDAWTKKPKEIPQTPLPEGNVTYRTVNFPTAMANEIVALEAKGQRFGAFLHSRMVHALGAKK
jgi:hypothetical protein